MREAPSRAALESRWFITRDLWGVKKQRRLFAAPQISRNLHISNSFDALFP